MEETPQLRVAGTSVYTYIKETKPMTSLFTNLQFTKFKITIYYNFKVISTSQFPINYKLLFKCQHVNTAVNRTIFYHQKKKKKLFQAFNSERLNHIVLSHTKSHYSDFPFKAHTT